MTWTNPLDRVPQIPVDWANHICQGGLYSMPLTALAYLYGPPVTVHEAALVGFGIMAFVSVLKKLVDYFKEGESLGVCVGKALVTVLWPASLVLATWPGLR